jgi:hypothetical protein
MKKGNWTGFEKILEQTLNKVIEKEKTEYRIFINLEGGPNDQTIKVVDMVINKDWCPSENDHFFKRVDSLKEAKEEVALIKDSLEGNWSIDYRIYKAVERKVNPIKSVEFIKVI